MQHMIFNFIRCGVLGWSLECAFTGFCQLLSGNSKLTCTTSIWMFFIYGLAVFIIPIYNAIKHLSILLRSLIYAILITSVEYISGSVLLLFNGCPWNYNHAPLNYDGLIRLDYFPLWMMAGLLFEYILCKRPFSNI